MIYFAQPIGGGPIKIGFTDDLDLRVKQIEGHYGQPLALLGTMPGGCEEERDIHLQFAHLRFGRTEQFRPASDLLAFIGRPLLVGANPDAAEAMAPRMEFIRVSKEFAEKVKQASGERGMTAAEFCERHLFLQPQQNAARSVKIER